MLSDEEKQALEEFKRWIEFEKNNKDKINNADLLIEVQEILLNLIEKQSKEIEELKEENKKYIVQLTDEQYRKLVDIIRDETSKEWEDKIKAKIEENKWAIEHYNCDEADSKQSQAVGAWNVLQRLLKESEIWNEKKID